jgi:hypothetical protein
MNTKCFRGPDSKRGRCAGFVGSVLVFVCVVVSGCSSPTDGDRTTSNVAGKERSSDRGIVSDPDARGCRYYQGENPSREEFIAQTQSLVDREFEASLISAEERDAAVDGLSAEAAPGRSSVIATLNAVPAGAASGYTKWFCGYFATTGNLVVPESMPELRAIQLDSPVSQLTSGLSLCIVAEDPATRATLRHSDDEVSRILLDTTISHLCPHLN